MTPELPTHVRVAVIGAGQAGLSAAHHLSKSLDPWTDYVVLDASEGPGGAWRHRWKSLTLGGAHGIHDLPGMPLGRADPNEPSSEVVTRYYGAYEREFDLPVARPIRVRRVSDDEGDGHTGALTIIWEGPDGAQGELTAVHVINATGTWNSPYWPSYPGMREFRGRQLHTHDYVAAEEFTGQRVAAVGAGASAVQFLLMLHEAGAQTVWVTRREPEWIEGTNDIEWGREVERKVQERTTAGLPAGSVVSNTGIHLRPEYRRGIEQGVLVSSGPMTRVTETGIELADGRQVEVDAILWATGFRPTIAHLAPLKLREPGGGIIVDRATVAKEPRLSFVGYGASASTLGATRAGRSAAMNALRAIGLR